MGWEQVIFQTVLTCVATLVGGAFTLIGVLLTLKKQKEKDDKEKVEKIESQRPELEIEEFIDLHKYDENEKCDLEIFAVKPKKYIPGNGISFDNDDFNKEKWVSIIYKFRNVGKTAVKYMYVSTNFTAHTALLRADKCNTLLPEIPTCVPYGQMIYTQKTFTLKICYPTVPTPIEWYPPAPNGSSVSLWLIDTNKRWWEHRLQAPMNNMSSSLLTSEDVFSRWNSPKPESGTIVATLIL